MGGLQNFLRGALDFLFPRHCVNCGKSNPNDGYGHLCAECRNAPFARPVNRCLRCAEMVGAAAPVFRCAACENSDFYFDAAKVACEYSGAGAALVRELKYKNAPYIARDIAKIISESAGFAEYFKGAVLAPVPLHKRKMRKRGYNQSAKICAEIARQNPNLNIAVAEILRRKKFTQTQTALDKDDRTKNVKGAFEIAKNNLPKDSKIIVLDDVMTSGATLNECAKVLKRAGFKSVRAFAFARRS
ncbi:MAG: ComF family protein [Opitutales bacterium]|nr:ComF family protein [Opitutales bacterium]